MLLQLCAVGGTTKGGVGSGFRMFPWTRLKVVHCLSPLQVPEAEVSSCSRLGLLPLEAEQLTGGKALHSLLLLSTDISTTTTTDY